MKKVLLRFVTILMVVYILNPFFGVDLLPDNLPLVGNLDEALATIIAMSIERYLLKLKKERKNDKTK